MKEFSTVIPDVIVINEGERFRASVLIEDGRIKRIDRSPAGEGGGENDLFLLPGVIDGHVHMREPGLTHKATMESETRAAARGGVTSVLDMPNVVPQTTTLRLLQERYALAMACPDGQTGGTGRCHVNFGFFLGATNDNIEEIRQLDPSLSPGVKVFMGSSTGGMLVDREETLRQVFRHSPTLIVTHCEDTARINSRTSLFVGTGDGGRFTPPLEGTGEASIRLHPLIRDHEACLRSTELAVRLAREEGARLHVAHITTAQELDLFRPGDDRITAEACVPHLLFSDEDYDTLGARIKCNPAIKTRADRDALRRALSDGRIRTIATDHAPHLPSEKQGGLKAMSGMPMVQFSLPAVLSLADEGVLSLGRAVELMCHNPALLYGIPERGFIREGYRADLVLVRRRPWTVTKDCIQSKCGWSPMEGRTFNWQVRDTICNGNFVLRNGKLSEQIKGEQIKFNHDK